MTKLTDRYDQLGEEIDARIARLKSGLPRLLEVLAELELIPLVEEENKIGRQLDHFASGNPRGFVHEQLPPSRKPPVR